ncbi:hypothetical protein BJ170DRAFT_640171 [Xylariales sp. AK1849]|nr:hypothetical protein BJ170DRAFT_640171 [Xylariales sp. AK1849]
MERNGIRAVATNNSLLHPLPNPQPSSPSGYQPLLKRKREPRTQVACESCRKRKAKCDGRISCGPCQKSHSECVYTVPRLPLVGSREQSVAPQTGLSQTGKSDAIVASSEGSNSGRDDECYRTQARSLRPISSGGGAQAVEPSRISDPGNAHHLRNICSGPAVTGDEQEYELLTENLDDENQDTASLQEVNRHTRGYEFYGATGVFPLLNRLHSRARLYHQQHQQSAHAVISEYEQPGPSPLASSSPRDPPTARSLDRVSLVNYLYNPDDVARSGKAADESDAAQPGRSSCPTPLVSRPSTDRLLVTGPPTSSVGRRPASVTVGDAQPSISTAHDQTPASVASPTSGRREIEIERYFVKLYFENLHLVSPVLDKSSFLAECDTKRWQSSSTSSEDQTRRSLTPRSRNYAHRDNDDRFEAVYYAVAALGAIVAPGDCLQSAGIRPQSETDDVASLSPLTWAKRSFKKAQANLGDVIQVCSLQSTQALFLLSVFSQNALQPHNCYMYSGMAARTALAIGLPDKRICRSDKQLRTASKTWWSIYSHETEMCCSSGRDSLLRERTKYSIQTPSCLGDHGDNAVFITVMTSLAEILSKTSSSLYEPTSDLTLSEKSSIASAFDDALRKWRVDMPQRYSFDNVSLKEPESISKQKTVLKLRYYNARILIHRTFLECADHERTQISPHVEACLDASRRTIDLIYNTYLHRPYFRTWWYNTTYTLNATIIVLYVIFQGFATSLYSELSHDVQKSLEIFQAMDEVVVARNCAALIQEILQMARIAMPQRFQGSNEASSTTFMSGLSEQMQVQMNGTSPTSERPLHVPLHASAGSTSEGRSVLRSEAMQLAGHHSQSVASTNNDSLSQPGDNVSYFSPQDNLFTLLFEQDLLESINLPMEATTTGHVTGEPGRHGEYQDSQSAMMPTFPVSPDDEGREWAVYRLANEGVLPSS